LLNWQETQQTESIPAATWKGHYNKQWKPTTAAINQYSQQAAVDTQAAHIFTLTFDHDPWPWLSIHGEIQSWPIHRQKMKAIGCFVQEILRKQPDGKKWIIAVPCPLTWSLVSNDKCMHHYWLPLKCLHYLDTVPAEAKPLHYGTFKLRIACYIACPWNSACEIITATGTAAAEYGAYMRIHHIFDIMNLWCKFQHEHSILWPHFLSAKFQQFGGVFHWQPTMMHIIVFFINITQFSLHSHIFIYKVQDHSSLWSNVTLTATLQQSKSSL